MSAEARAPNGAQRLRDHIDGCADCQAAPVPLATLHRILSTGTVLVDAAQLSTRALVHLRPALERNAQRAMWKRAVAAVSVALLPLPMVVAYAAVVLWGVYTLSRTLLPPPVAAYLVGSYAATLALVVAVTYAAIPIWLATQWRDAGAAGR